MTEHHLKGDGLINEAIKRILLDIVIRGHGDRLIGRWSREPELQQFLEQVPYMLDRISQLHLACTRTEHLEPGNIQHHYHKHKHHHHHHHQHQDSFNEQFNQTSLTDFINLIGPDLHWLVRTRDALGLTPLHKAVLFNNRPIVEYILDRYPEELAPVTWRHQLHMTPQDHVVSGSASTRLIDAQDKYGRTALHYAAAHLGTAAAVASKSSSSRADDKLKREKYFTISHLYHFLVSKGASLAVSDFKGKMAPHYVRHPNDLRVKSIVHLANKLNANYQANVLSKTLRAASGCMTAASNESIGLHRSEMISLAECAGNESSNLDKNNRESMSVSCNDLTAMVPDTRRINRSHSTMHEVDEFKMLTCQQQQQQQQTKAQNKNGEPTTTTTTTTKIMPAAELENKLTEQPPPFESNPSRRPESPGSTMSLDEHLSHQDEELALKHLQAERLKAQQILSQQDKLRLQRCLNEGVIDKINEFLVDGFGLHLMQQANLSCWNQQCRRYINKVIPDKLNKLDHLHELIAKNQNPIALRKLLQQEPILARMLRPYRRASMNALHLAVYFDRKVLVKYLTDSFPELVQQRDSQGATCLHWAARCLKHDRLYCWLLDKFGAQLEQMRDLRGKSAANYRQQALRLSTFDETHPVLRDNHQSARDIMDQNQEISTRLLSLGGSRMKLNEHPGVIRKRATQTTRECSNKGTSIRGDKEPDPSSTPPSSLLFIDSSTSTESNISGTNKHHQDETKTSPEQQKIYKPANIRVRRLVPSASTDNQPTTLKAADESRCERRLSEQPQTKELDEQINHSIACEEPSSSNQSFSPNENVFLGEFADLDLSSSGNEVEGTIVDSLGAKPISPTQLVNSIGRPESASSRQRFDLMIIDSIKSEDYKKLEHLILAGCGERLLRVWEESKSGDVERSLFIGDKMREYMDKTVPDYMGKIAKIYEVLHRCYGKVAPIMKAITTLDMSEDRNEPTANNSTFHKLCNLLDKKRLIMSRDSYGACPLHVALIRSDARLVEYLLRRHPEAASAPDHESRTALHYAAIVLAAHSEHGTFKLTCQLDDNNNNNNTEVGVENKSIREDDKDAWRGFWLVDEQARLTYDKLCLRYGELLDARDKHNLTCGQYLESGRRQVVAHVSLAKLGGSSQMSLLPAERVFSECCPEYAQLLSRYNYCLLLDSVGDRSPLEDDKQQANIDQPIVQQRQATIADDHSETTTIAQTTAVESLPANEVDKLENPNDLVAPESQQQAEHEESYQVPASQTPEVMRRSTTRRPKANQALLNGQIIMSSSAAGQLAAPPPQSATARQPIRQVAPKPTVGSELGYPLMSHSSPTVSGPSNNNNTNHHHHHHSSLLGSHRRKLVADAPDYLDIQPVASGSSSKSHNHKTRRHHHRRGHHHRRRHATMRRVHRSSATTSALNDSLASKSLVGGVIVPTIIHNDKMDEIETYDIIYRQPPTNLIQNAVSQESIAGLSSSSSLSLSDSCSSSCSVASIASLSSNSSKATTNQQLNEHLVPKTIESGSVSGSSSSSSDDDDDERVERLSDEFESRVRREKSELRAKVDQIMNEIKMSAKSGKSSRFLASPLNNNDNTKQQNDSNNNNKGGPSNSSQKVMFATDIGGPDVHKRRHQSLSSSGPHSCSNSNSNSSGSSLSASRTASAASSSSHSSTCSSSSTASTFSASSSRVPGGGGSHHSKQPQRDGLGTVTVDALKQQQQQQLAASTQGTQLTSKNTYGQTYMHFIASRSQNASTLYKVLKHGSYLIGERDIFYRTARDVAIQFNLANNVQILDKFVIDLFVEGKTTLLHHLLNQGYSPLIHVSDPDGNDIMLILKLLKLDRMIHFLLQMADFQRWRDELHTFIRNGYSGGVSELLRKHKDLVRAKSVHARTSLHLAVLFDRVGMVEELIEADPLSVHAIDNMGRTALHYTYGLQSMANVELIRDKLIAAGATPDVRDVKMRTPKYYYIFKREIEEIKRIELELN